MKTVLSVQDLSCVGRCSLTVALPVLSAMGCRCSVLPTAVLSTHTGFPGPHVISLTDHISSIFDHFSRLDLSFDAVTTGYLANPKEVWAVTPILQHYRDRGSLIVTDPAMGDHGRLYSGLDAAHVEAMADICRHADILLPNVTEAALLTGLPYREDGGKTYWKNLLDALMDRFPATAVVITGVSEQAGAIGFTGCHRQNGAFTYQAPVVQRQFHGTGDLFAAVFVGSLLRGNDVCQAGIRAAEFVRICVSGTPEESLHGVEFESHLCALSPEAPPINTKE